MKICTRCQSAFIVKNGKHLNAQRYRCKGCGYQFTRKEARGRPGNEKALALLLYSFGLRKNVIARLLNVSSPSVGRWVKDGGDDLHEGRKKWEHCMVPPEQLMRHLNRQNILEGEGTLILVLPVCAATSTSVVITPDAG